MKLESVSKAEAARYMGVRGIPDEKVSELLERAEKLVIESVEPKYVYRFANIEECENGIEIEETSILLTGNSIRSHLKECSRIVLFAATLSAEADKLIRQTAVENVALSLAVDCICSAAVEQVCGCVEEEIFSKIPETFRTWRYSPGYGDLPIELQSSLLKLLNAERRIGLTSTNNSLLIPTKSVTAIIGISDKPLEKAKTGCSSCRMNGSCAFSINGLKKCHFINL